MKTRIFPALLLAFSFCIACFEAIGQDVDSEDPAPGATITPDPKLLADFNVTALAPAISSSSVIFYEDGISIQIELQAQGTVPATIILTDKVNASDYRSLPVTNGSAQYWMTATGRNYDIKAVGADGKLYIVGTLHTNPFRGGDPVVVSNTLYRALARYVANVPQTTTLSTYLKQLPGVSQHEKISFLQRYVMNGAVLPSTIKGQYPDYYTQKAIDSRRVEGECLCNFVMNQVTTVIPDEDGSGNFNIKPKTSSLGPKMYNGASFWLRGLTAQGPAKKQLLLNSGHLAGNKRRIESWTTGAENYSDNSVQIGYHLMCIGFTELPSACDCSKTAKFDFGYSSKIEARTDVGGLGCLLEQDANARVQDWAVAFVTRENANNINDVQILAAGTSIAISTCEGGVPPGVIVDAIKIGTSVFEMIKSIKNFALTDLINQTNQIIDKVGAIVEQFVAVKECQNAALDKPLIQGSATLTFRPNDPIVFVIMSGSNLGVSGLRCWESIASVESSFHLSGVVVGGAPSPNAPHCCTDYFANWAIASQKGDYTSRQNLVRNYLSLNSPGGWQFMNGAPNINGTLTIPTDIGYVTGKNLPNGQQCAKQVDIIFNPH